MSRQQNLHIKNIEDNMSNIPYSKYEDTPENTEDEKLKKESRWGLKNAVSQAARGNKREVTILEASKIINTPPSFFYKAIDTKVLHWSSPDNLLLLDVLGWNQENYYRNMPNSSPSWALDFARDGHGYIPNVFCQKELDILSSIVDELYEQHKEDSKDPQTSFDITYDGTYYLERMRWLWKTPLLFMLGHPIFDEVSQAMFGTKDWLPFLYMGIFKQPGSLPTTCHRDLHWSLPEDFQHMRFLCQIQLTPPIPGDGGLEFLPESHRLQKDRPMTHQYLPRTNDYRPFYGHTIYDMNIHNIGVLHTVGSNTSSLMMKRLYIGVIPSTDPALNKPFPTEEKRKEIQEYLHKAKRDYKSIIG